MSRGAEELAYHNWELQQELNRRSETPPGWDAMCRENGDLHAENERMRDALEQIETLARNALTKPWSALRVIESLAYEALIYESEDA